MLIKTIKAGDGKIYANINSFVIYKHIGYIYDRVTNTKKRYTNNWTSIGEFVTSLNNDENIIGLKHALCSMTKGEIAQVYIPSRLGYGNKGFTPPFSRESIPPNMDLILQLTFVNVEYDNDIYHLQDVT